MSILSLILDPYRHHDAGEVQFAKVHPLSILSTGRFPSHRLFENHGCPLVRLESGRGIVAIHLPHLAILEVVKQVSVSRFAHVTGPYDLGALDIRLVPYPFQMDVVMR